MNTIRRTEKTALKKKKDFYQTNPLMVTSLINYLKQNKFRRSLKVLDPCEGQGVISKGLNTYFKKVSASDLYNDDNIDFLETEEKYNIIVMNPPYSAKYKFIDHARKHARYVFCLLPLNVSNYNMFHRQYEDIPEFVGKLQMAPKMFLDETIDFKPGGTTQYC